MTTPDMPKIATARPSLKSRATSGAIWISLETIGVQGMSFAVFAVIARFISPSDVGLMSISFSLIFSLKFLILDNVVVAVTRKHEASDIEYTTAFWITFGLGILSFLILVACAGWAEIIFHAPGLTRVMREMSPIAIFISLGRVHEAWLVRHFQLRAIAIRGISGTAVGSLIGIILAVRGFGVTALIAQQISAALVSVSLLWISCPWRPGIRISRQAALEIGEFLKGITANGMVNVVNQNCDTFLVAYFFGPASVGIYNVGKRVRMALQSVAAGPITGVAYPTLAEIQNDPARLRRVLLIGIMVVCAASGPVFLGASAISHEMVIVMFGQKWFEAIPVLELLSVGGLIMVLLGLNDIVFITHKRQTWTFYISLTYSILAVIGFALCTKFGIKSLALPFLLPYLVTFPVSVALVCRRINLPFKDWVTAIRPGILASLAMYAIVKLVDSRLDGLSNLVRLIILCPMGAAIYVAALWMFGRTAAETLLDILRNIIRRKRQKPTAVVI